MSFWILAINPGSTSTKTALYEDEKELFCSTLEHFVDELDKYDCIQEQLQMRKAAVLKQLEQKGFDINKLSAVVGRGGILPPVKSGAYIVNESMLETLKKRPVFEHASNLGAPIAFEIAHSIGKTAYIYDSVAVDELKDIARISGMPEIKRSSFVHALNSRVMAMKTAEKYNGKYWDMNFIVAHIGGGISLSVHEKGRMVDTISDDEGPFSPERSGRVPCMKLIELCYSGRYSKAQMIKKLRGDGGLKAYLNTTDAKDIERKINMGDEYAKMIYEAMAYQVAKGIGELATVTQGLIDFIILTGGLANSKMMTSWIKKRVEFIGPVEIIPGEKEMEALALGILRVLRGEESAKEYNIIF